MHLKFNLSQELFTNPIRIDDLQAAELHLSRERIVNYNNNHNYNEDNVVDKLRMDAERSHFINQDTHSSDEASIINDGKEKRTSNKRGFESMNNNDNINYKNISTKENDATKQESETPSPSPITTTTPKNRFLNRARYQRLYLLHVLGYDEHNEPITRIHDSQIIDTHQSTPLMLDIYLIVKRWIQNPGDNFGIIIRITNDDKSYNAQRTKRQPGEGETTINSRQDEVTNASTTTTTTELNLNTGQNVYLSDNGSEARPQIVASTDNNSARLQLEEHVRLKRGFRSASEIDEVWIEKQPSIYIFSSPPEFSRRHVKRNTGSRSSSAPGGGSTRSKVGPKKPGARAGEKCGKKTLQINFDDVGWSSWIIAPQNYFANYCLGDCSFPMNDYQNATNHAIIQSIFHSAGRVVPRSCCAPTKLGKMAILYQLDGVVQMRHYDDMIVESCGCV